MYEISQHPYFKYEFINWNLRTRSSWGLSDHISLDPKTVGQLQLGYSPGHYGDLPTGIEEEAVPVAASPQWNSRHLHCCTLQLSLSQN